MGVVATISGAIDIAQKIIELKAVAKNADAMMLLASLKLALADAKTQLADMMTENLQLKSDLATATSPPVLLPKDGMYYKSDDDGPFCTICFDRDEKAIRLVEVGMSIWSTGRWSCGVCKTRFRPQQASASSGSVVSVSHPNDRRRR